MGNINQDDAQQLAPLLGITRECVTSPVPIDVRDYQCNRCGACCKNQNGIIISLNDAQLLARRLHVRLKYFVRTYCREASVYDIFGHGPFKGLAIKTRKGVCMFYSDSVGCTVNDAKPMVCSLYPFNTIHVTRASILKLQRKKDGDCYDGCFIFDLSNEGVIGPDFDALAAYCIQMETTREYYRLCDDRWQDDMAQMAISNGTRLSGDSKSIEMYARNLRLAFDEFDRRNGDVLLEMFADEK